MDLGKITLPPAPKVADNLSDYQRSVETWARQVEQTVRQFERAFNDLAKQVNTLTAK